MTITVTEPNSQSPVPCRIHLKDPAGNPVQAGALPFWRDHFVCPGTVQLELAAGAYSYEIERGPEYSQATGRVEVARGRTSAELVQIKRLANLPAAGWWPGELHVHRPVAEIELLMQAEDLHVAPVITWWNNRNLWTNQDPPPDRQLHVFDGQRTYHVMAGEDEREGGALLYDTREVRDLLRVLMAINDTASPITIVNALRTTVLAISDVELLAHRRAGGHWNPFVTDEQPAGHPAVLQALTWLRGWATSRHRVPVPELIAQVAQQSRSLAASMSDGAHVTTWRRLRLVLDEARWRFEQTGGSLGEYLRWVALRVDNDDRSNVTTDETG